MDQVKIDILVMVRNNFEGNERIVKMADVNKRFKRYAAFLQSGLSMSEMGILFYNSLIYPKAKKLYLRSLVSRFNGTLVISHMILTSMWFFPLLLQLKRIKRIRI